MYMYIYSFLVSQNIYELYPFVVVRFKKMKHIQVKVLQLGRTYSKMSFDMGYLSSVERLLK